jgi:hypothetical protein
MGLDALAIATLNYYLPYRYFAEQLGNPIRGPKIAVCELDGPIDLAFVTAGASPGRGRGLRGSLLRIRGESKRYERDEEIRTSGFMRRGVDADFYL